VEFLRQHGLHQFAETGEVRLPMLRLPENCFVPPHEATTALTNYAHSAGLALTAQVCISPERAEYVLTITPESLRAATRTPVQAVRA